MNEKSCEGSHAGGLGPIKPQKCEGCAIRATWVTLGINLALFLLKALFALDTRSRSLMADALESLVGVAIAGLVLFSLHVAAKAKDNKHSYGYGKIEFLAATIINFILLLGALGFIGASLWEIFTVGPEKPPSLIAAMVAAVSVAANYMVYKYSSCPAEKFSSHAVLANGAVNLTDSVTSGAVALAVVAANLGFYNLDSVVGLLIGLWIAKIALDGLDKSVKELLDLSPGEQSARIMELARGVVGAGAVREVKTRLVGRNLWVDMEVAIVKERTLGEGLQIVQRLKDSIYRDRRDIAEISVRLAAMK
ncbi:MAG: cation diffusion facilitator family transporter [Elusimicrobia bacterium]|nr:cation diffusion facilitator family transporter [Elusimicrobiota bacterium]